MPIATVKPFGDTFTSANNNEIMGTFNSSTATILALKHGLGDGVVVSTQLHPAGYEQVTINGGLTDVKQARALASLGMTPANQIEIATALRDETHLSEVLAKTLGIKPAAGSGVMKSNLKITSTYASDMADNFLSPYATAGESRKNSHALVQSIFAELFQQIGTDKSTYYSMQTPITHFFSPVTIKDDLANPFTAALVLDRIYKSPFSTFQFPEEKLEKIRRSEGRHIALGDLVACITHAAQNLITSFHNNGDYQGMVVIGLQLVSDVIHRRVDIPTSFNNHPVINTLRTNITFHNLTLDRDQGGLGHTFDGSGSNQIKEMIRLTREIADGSAGDDMLARKAALFGGSLDSNVYLGKLEEFINTYLDLHDVRDFAKFFGLEQFTANDDVNTVSAIRVSMDRSFPQVAPIFTGLQMEFKANNRTNKVATITRPVLDYTIPSLPEIAIVDAISEQIMNMDKAEVTQLITSYADGDGDEFTLGGMLMPLPGTAVNLITNMNNLDHSSFIDFANTRSDDVISVPYLVQLFSAAMAHEFTFTPNAPIEYTRKAELNAPLRTAQSQIPDVLSYDKHHITTTNPLHILVAVVLPEQTASRDFVITNPQVDLKGLIGTEFMMGSDKTTVERLKVEPIHRFTVPGIPKNRNDRRASLGREMSSIETLTQLREKVIVDGRFDSSAAIKVAEEQAKVADTLKFPFVYYRTNHISTASGERTQDVISAPIDLHQVFGFYDELFVSSIVSYVSFDDQLNSILDAIQDMSTVFPNAGSKPYDRLGDIITSVAGSYVRVGLARPDVINLQINNKLQQNEFATMYALGIFVDIAQRMELISAVTGVRLMAVVDSIDRSRFEKVSANVMALIAKRHTGVN